MGIIMSSYRKMYLTAYKYSLESKLRWITIAKSELCASSEEIATLGNDLDPNNPAVKQLHERMARLDALEKRLDLQAQEYSTRLEMVKVELDSIKSSMQSEIQEAFSVSL